MLALIYQHHGSVMGMNWCRISQPPLDIACSRLGIAALLHLAELESLQRKPAEGSLVSKRIESKEN